VSRVRTTASDADAISDSLRDPGAFVTIFDRHFDAIRNYLARRIGDDAAADLAAETFTRAFDARKRYDLDHVDARPWLYGIASNVMRRHARDERRRLRAYAEVAAQPHVPERDGQPFSAEVAAALAALSPEEREVLFLFVWADLSYEDIARALGIPIGTVRSRLGRARARAATALAPQLAHVRLEEPVNG
jgi:RNA polymerase sigma factor (sigma-70 family)